MADEDDLEEIDLSPRREGNAHHIRAGRKRALKAMTENKNRPLWKRQLRAGKHKDRAAPKAPR